MLSNAVMAAAVIRVIPSPHLLSVSLVIAQRTSVRLVRVFPHDPPADATDNPDDADDQDKQAQRPFQSVGRKCVEHQYKPDRYET